MKGCDSMIYISHLIDDIEMKEILSKGLLGIESIEFSIGENLDKGLSCIEAYRKRMEKMECRELTIHGPFLDINPVSFDSLVRSASRKRFEMSYEAGEALGAEKMICHTCMLPGIYYLEGWSDMMAEFWKEFLKDKGKMKFCLENVLDEEYKPIAEVIEKVSDPRLGICLDIGHANCYSPYSVMEWVNSLGKYITHVHVHDNNGIKDQHLALGRGNIPAEELIKEIKKHNPKVDWTIECTTKDAVLETIKYLI